MVGRCPGQPEMESFSEGSLSLHIKLLKHRQPSGAKSSRGDETQECSLPGCSRRPVWINNRSVSGSIALTPRRGDCLPFLLLMTTRRHRCSFPDHNSACPPMLFFFLFSLSCERDGERGC